MNLTASAGVAPNKFLAKIASDWRKPDGLFVIKPHQVQAFLDPLPVRKIPGVGKVMNQRLADLGIDTVAQLRACEAGLLEARFGSMGRMLQRRAHGIDDSPVQPHRPVQSVSAEDTFAEDLPLSALGPAIERLADKVWQAQHKTPRVGRTVVLKLKTADFRLLTRSHTPPQAPQSAQELTRIALELRHRAPDTPGLRYRLVGVGLGNFTEVREIREQSGLFDVEGVDAPI